MAGYLEYAESIGCIVDNDVVIATPVQQIQLMQWWRHATIVDHPETGGLK